MKKGIIILLSILLISISMMPSFIYADQISGFDYTNYYQLEYVQGNQAGYINTGYKPSRNTIIEGQFKNGTTGYFLGVNSDGGSTGYYTFFLDTDDRYGFRLVTSSKKNLNDIFTDPFTITINPRSIIEATDGINTLSLNTSSSNTTVASKNMFLLANNNQGSVSSKSNHYMYYCFIKDYSTSNYVKKYYPAERKSDGVIGVYDTVNSEFIEPTGGTLVAGPRLTTTYTISTSVSPSGAGSVTGGGTYNAGATVTLTASANTGYVFDHWSDNNTDNPRYVTATSNQSYTAVFVQSGTPIQTYTISTSVTPSGSGSVSGGGTYNSGTTVSLTATANNGYQFDQWSDGNTDNPRSITVTADASYTAEFVAYTPPVQSYTVTASASPSGSGSVTGSGSYQYGSIATLTAVPSSGYVFSSWSDGVTINPRQIEVTSNITLTAYFMDQSIIDSILVGTNLNLIEFDYEYNPITAGTSINGSIHQTNTYDYTVTYSFLNLDSSSRRNALWEIHSVLNDNYIGYALLTITYYPNGSSTPSVLSNKRVYVNGTEFRTNLFVGDNFSNDITVAYNFTNLFKNQSVQSLIQDGTNESNESVNDLDDASGEMNDQFNQYADFEDSMSGDFTEQLENLNMDDPFQQNQGLLSSASFVITIFNGLINGNPIGTMMIIACILLIAKKVIGNK